MLTTVRRHWLTYAALTTAPLLITGLTACGGSDSGSSSSSPAASSSGASTAANDPQFRWELRFTKCLREQGIQVADPDPVKGAPDVTHDAAYRKASQTCEVRIGDPPTAVANRGKEKQNQDAGLKAAKCLRDNGYDVSDPTPEQALVVPVDVSSAVLGKCLTPEKP